MKRLPSIPAKVPLDAADFEAERREREAAAARRIDAAALFAAIPADRYAEAEAQAARQAPPSPAPPAPSERTPEQRQLDQDAKRLFDAIPDEFYGALDTPGSGGKRFSNPATTRKPEPAPPSVPEFPPPTSPPKLGRQRFARLRFRWP
jgi:hypothetical protein